MKKFIAAFSLLLSTYAFAGLPAGYEEQAVSENQKSFVNASTGAVISLLVNDAGEEVSAKDALVESAKELKCTGTVEGDANIATVNGCPSDSGNLEVTVLSSEGQILIIYANDKVTDEEGSAFVNWLLNE